MTPGPAGGFASTGIRAHPGHADQKSHGRRGGGSFDDAATGDEALRLAAVARPLSDMESRAIDRYGGEAYESINGRLRNGEQVQDRHTDVVSGLDSVMASSALTRDVVVYRKVVPERVFGDAASGDLTGLRFRDAAYVSTSATRREPNSGARLVMRILAPAGTRGFSHSSRTSGLDSDEILLDRGLTFWVVADPNPTSTVRDIDVVVES